MRQIEHGRVQRQLILRQKVTLPLGTEIAGEEKARFAAGKARDDSLIVVGGAREGLIAGVENVQQQAGAEVEAGAEGTGQGTVVR